MSFATFLSTKTNALAALIPFVGATTTIPDAHKSSANPATGSKTKWLDGLRGVASFFVVIFHYYMCFYPEQQRYLYDGGGQKGLTQLPFIRIIFSGGDWMVHIFFVISGYALSHRSLTLIHSRRVSDATDALVSSTFRRGMRLFALPFVSCFLGVFVTYNHAYNWAENARPWIPAWNADPASKSTLYLQFVDMWQQFLTLSNVWTNERVDLSINPNLWTIPLEYKCSIVLFITLLGLSKTGPLIRVVSIFLMGVHNLSYGYWYLSLFLFGAVIAEINILQSAGQAQGIDEDLIFEKENDFEIENQSLLPSDSYFRGYSSIMKQISAIIRNRRLRNLIFNKKLMFLLGNAAKCCTFIISLWLGSLPFVNNYGDRYYYQHIVQYTFAAYNPPHVFWYVVGATLFLWSCTQSTCLQWIFATRICQYLGKISFALYVVHRLFMQSLGFWTTMVAWQVFGRESSGQIWFGVIAGFVVFTGVSMILAHFLTVYIDGPSVKFAKKVENYFVK